MSWFTKALDNSPMTLGFRGLDVLTKGLSHDLEGHDSSIASGVKNVADFYQSEMVDKKDLRLAQAESVLSGIPIVGGVINGIEGAEKLEDYYANTGKVPEYPASSGLSASGLGAGLSAVGNSLGRSGVEYKSGKMSLEDLYLSYY